MEKNFVQTILYIAKNMSIVVGIVLIWRGIWYLLDFVDGLFFEGNHLPLAVAGIIVGILMLYLPDKDLKEIEKL
jgi:hypothetical protein